MTTKHRTQYKVIDMSILRKLRLEQINDLLSGVLVFCGQRNGTYCKPLMYTLSECICFFDVQNIDVTKVRPGTNLKKVLAQAIFGSPAFKKSLISWIESESDPRHVMMLED